MSYIVLQETFSLPRVLFWRQVSSSPLRVRVSAACVVFFPRPRRVRSGRAKCLDEGVLRPACALEGVLGILKLSIL